MPHGSLYVSVVLIFFFQAEDGIRDHCVTGVQTCALPILQRTRQGSHERPLCLRPRAVPAVPGPLRSEERRVGKEGRSEGGACVEKAEGVECRAERRGGTATERLETRRKLITWRDAETRCE